MPDGGTGIRLASEPPGREELLDLYRSVGWTAYTDEPDTLVAAVAASRTVLCVRSSSDEQLVGLARTISDGRTIVYLQRRFYESRGLVEAHDVRPGALRSFVRPSV